MANGGCALYDQMIILAPDSWFFYSEGVCWSAQPRDCSFNEDGTMKHQKAYVGKSCQEVCMSEGKWFEPMDIRDQNSTSTCLPKANCNAPDTDCGGSKKGHCRVVTNTPGDYVCLCEKGWSGANCQTEVTDHTQDHMRYTLRYFVWDR